MPSGKAIVSGAIITVVGVFAAGFLMNALRDNDIVKKAINGFDS